MDNKKKITVLIGLAFIVALFFRTWRLSTLPASLSMDEVTFGYASYSVMNTLRDEYGNFLPLSFKGIGDYKPPIDVYLNIPFILIFGLNELGVRLSGAILGSLSVVVLIYFVRLLKFSWKTSIFSGFWLAVSGWHILYSRAGYEAITALFFLLLGTYYFLKWRDSESKTGYLTLSVLFYSLSAWSYHAERLFVPLLFGYLIITNKKRFERLIKQSKWQIPFIVLLLFSLPFAYSLFMTEGVGSRMSELLITKSPDLVTELDKGVVSYYFVIRQVVGQYMGYFNLSFLFWKALGFTPERFQDVGLIYAVNIPLFFVGLYRLFRQRKSFEKDLLIFWLLTAPVPAALTRGDPSPIRILLWVPVFAIIISIGFESLSKLKNHARYVTTYFILLFVNFLYFVNLYTLNFYDYFGDLWHFGYKEAVIYACNNYQNYEKVVITNKYGIELPNTASIPDYYVLFHCSIDPRQFQSDRKLYNIEIRQPQWRIDRANKNILLIGSRWDFPEGFPREQIIKIIKFPNGKDAFYFVKGDGVDIYAK